MNTSRVAHLGLAFASLLLAASTTSCTTAGKQAVPGVTRSPIDSTPIEAREVLLALKAQVAEAYKTIKAEKEADKSLDGVFELKKGTGVFSGTTQVVHTGSAALSAVIPFTGYTDSKLKPKLALSGNATNLQFTSLTFALEPEPGKAEPPRPYADPATTIQGTFIRDAIIAYFRDAVSLARQTPTKPILRISEIAVSATFTVVRKYEAGLGETIIMMPAPDLDSLGPTGSGSREKTGTYKIELKIPFNVDATPETRRLTVLQVLPDGRAVLVEEPYTEEKYQDLIDALRKPAGVTIEKTDPMSTAPGARLGPAKEPRGL